MFALKNQSLANHVTTDHSTCICGCLTNYIDRYHNPLEERVGFRYGHFDAIDKKTYDYVVQIHNFMHGNVQIGPLRRLKVNFFFSDHLIQLE